MMLIQTLPTLGYCEVIHCLTHKDTVEYCMSAEPGEEMAGTFFFRMRNRVEHDSGLPWNGKRRRTCFVWCFFHLYFGVGKYGHYGCDVDRQWELLSKFKGSTPECLKFTIFKCSYCAISSVFAAHNHFTKLHERRQKGILWFQLMNGK